MAACAAPEPIVPADAIGGLVSGALAASWIGLLWFAAGPYESTADRLRTAMALGVAIPFAAAFLHVLYWPALYAGALACAWHARRRGRAPTPIGGAPPLAQLLPLAAIAAVAWPALARPPLDGDTLAYHLPNALAWVRAGSIWTTETHYWWYPGGSELFAAGVIAAGGWWSAGLSGALAAALVGLRLANWGCRLGASPLTAGLVAAAFVATPVAALQAGDLQNDLWLGAFFLESLWLLDQRSNRAAQALAVAALVKPYGALYAAIAALCGRATVRHLAAALPLAAWALRDALLWRNSLIPPSTTAYPGFWQTSIVAHGNEGIRILGFALLHAGAPTIAWFALPIAGLALGRVRVQAVAATLATSAFVALPFGFAGSLPQLAGGAALRFDLPAMAFGALVACALAARWPAPIGICAAAAVLAGVEHVREIFWNDVASRAAIPLATVALVIALRSPPARAAAAAAVCTVIAAAGALSAARAVAFYDASLRAPNDAPTRVFSWLADEGPGVIVTLNVRAGAPATIARSSNVLDGLDGEPCAQARRAGAVLFVGTDPDVGGKLREGRFALARACGRVLFEDGAAIVVRPR